MGRGNLIRLVAVLAGALAAVASATAATGVRWSPLFSGTTEPTGSQAAVGYIAVTRAQERTWSGRLATDDRAALGRVNLTRNAVVAVFLDGMPCGSHLATQAVTRTSPTTLHVRIAYTRPPIGMAMCVRTSTPYIGLTILRQSLGRPAPTQVTVDARARA
jgi:hypothetical protein